MSVVTGAVTKEMRDMHDACVVHDAAKVKLEAAQVALREAMREVASAESRKTIALDALERACRAPLPTLPDPEGA